MRQDIPEILTPRIRINSPNKDIEIKKGAFNIHWQEKLIKVQGKLILKWLPEIRLKLYGTFKENFSYNFIEFFTTSKWVKITSGKNFSCKGYIHFISSAPKPHNIICTLVDPIVDGDSKGKIDELKESGGYNLLYTGKVISSKGKLFTYERANNILSNFSVFLNFLNGRRTSPILCVGYLKNKIIWKFPLLKHFEYKGEIDDRCQAAGNSSWE